MVRLLSGVTANGTDVDQVVSAFLARLDEIDNRSTSTGRPEEALAAWTLTVQNGFAAVLLADRSVVGQTLIEALRLKFGASPSSRPEQKALQGKIIDAVAKVSAKAQFRSSLESYKVPALIGGGVVLVGVLGWALLRR